MTQNNKAGARSRFIKASPRLIRWLWIIAFAPVALLVFLLLLTATGLFGRLPSFEELENPKSNLATEIYSEDGKVLGTFFVQNRSYVQYDELYPADSTLHIRLGGHEVPPSWRRSSPPRMPASAATRASTSPRWPAWR